MYKGNGIVFAVTIDSFVVLSWQERPVRGFLQQGYKQPCCFDTWVLCIGKYTKLSCLLLLCFRREHGNGVSTRGQGRGQREGHLSEVYRQPTVADAKHTHAGLFRVRRHHQPHKGVYVYMQNKIWMCMCTVHCRCRWCHSSPPGAYNMYIMNIVLPCTGFSIGQGERTLPLKTIPSFWNF